MTYEFRLATPDDMPRLECLIAESVWGLGRGDYSNAQIEAALGTAWVLTTELIRDGTYFVAVDRDEIVACGGWSYRTALFGGDGQEGRGSDVLDPASQPARIRAFFVRPDRARQGIGRTLLRKCEEEAWRHGFRSVELMATLPGRRLYQTCGYQGEATVMFPLPGGISIAFVPMHKDLQSQDFE